MSRVLWIGDAGTQTGFSRVCHAIGERLIRDHGHELHVLAVGWDARWPVETPMKLYRAEAGLARSRLGMDRVVEVIEAVQPDIVITLEDPPQLRQRLLENRFDPEQVLLKHQPIISYLPVDSYNVPPAWKTIPELVTAVAMSQHGQDQLGTESFIYHGVDMDVFHPVEEGGIRLRTGVTVTTKAECREQFGIPEDAFVIGRVDTNSGRKDWGSTWRTIDAFQRLAKDGPEVVAVFHTKLRNPGSGANLAALITKGPGKYMVTDANDWPVDDVVALVNTFDVTLSNARGEGFGLGLLESLACGVPVVASNVSAIPEVVGPGGLLTPGLAIMTNPYGADLWLSDTEAMVRALDVLYRHPEVRDGLSRFGLQHACSFSWDTAAAGFDHLIESRLSAPIVRVQPR